jgi:putative ABC transport system permease protein
MTDWDFMETYQLQSEAGRWFSRNRSLDTTGTIVLNEAAVNRFGWRPEHAVGKELAYFRSRKANIVGVVKDFNFRSLHTVVEPMAIILDPEYISEISIRVSPESYANAISMINKVWKDTYPGELFEYGLIDARIARQYENERMVQNLFMIFSLFAIFVACLGLFGLSVYMAGRRTKEIGIRKVMGASMTKIILLITKRIVSWIILATLIAWPLAWLIMSRWLQKFAYKTNFTWSIFIGSALLALAIALITISFHSIKAARANPIQALRYE